MLVNFFSFRLKNLCFDYHLLFIHLQMASAQQDQNSKKKLWEKPQNSKDGEYTEGFDSCLAERLTLPEELKDDQQAAVLYSPFREKSLNPRSWARKMEFWKNFLFKTALENEQISFSANTLPTLFQRKGITPKCFATVIEELEKYICTSYI